MLHIAFRALGIVLLAFAAVLTVIDMTRSITAGGLVISPLSQLVEAVRPGTMTTLSESVPSATHEWVWNPLLTSLLALPSWLVVAALAFVVFRASQRRERPLGRFSGR